MSPATRHHSVDVVVTVRRTVEPTSSHDVDGRLFGTEPAVWPLTAITEQLHQLHRDNVNYSLAIFTHASVKIRFIMTALRSRRGHYIFILWFLSFFFVFIFLMVWS